MSQTGTILQNHIDAIADLDEGKATKVIEDAIAAGMTVVAVLDDIIGPAQAWVGKRWLAGDWSVAREHRATAINSRIVTSLRMPPTTHQRERVLIASAEGEWHTLPAAMLEVALASADFEVNALDGPLPASQLLSYIHEIGPRCVLVSCIMAANLPGLRKVSSVAREAGVPVVLGGSAVTPDRAVLLGGNAHATNIASAVQAIESLPGVAEPAPSVDHARTAGFDWLDLHMGTLGASFASLSSSLGTDAATDGIWMLRSLNAALLCDEPSILAGQIEWQNLRQKTMDAVAAETLIDQIRSDVAEGPPTVVATIDTALAQLTLGPTT